MFTTLSWVALIELLSAWNLLGHVLKGNAVGKLIFKYPDGQVIEVPADERITIEVHVK